jgi:DNA-binding NarL/FixJ family response regulator
MPDRTDFDRRRLRVMLVDDHPIVREGLRRRIEAQPDMDVCCEAESAVEALQQLGSCRFDLAIVDISIVGRSGIELIKDIRARKIETPVVVLSVHDDVTYAERALAAGAQGYVLKQEAPPLIIEAMRRVLAGEIFVSPRMSGKLLLRFVGTDPRSGGGPPVDRLSDREIEVLEHIGRGLGTRQIAAVLGLGISTVATFKSRIKNKLDLATAAELAAFAAKWVGGDRR